MILKSMQKRSGTLRIKNEWIVEIMPDGIYNKLFKTGVYNGKAKFI